jgi:hypothetical protein
LLYECVDWRFARDIVCHEIKTARQMGWTAIKNGELLMLASEQFDVFVTTDRSLSFQQNLVSFSVAVVVLRAKSNRLADLGPLIPNSLSAIEYARPARLPCIAAGSCRRKEIPQLPRKSPLHMGEK